MESVLYQILSPCGKPPSRKRADDAGYDIYAVTDVTVGARSRQLVKTGIALKIPEQLYGRIASRSGLSLKHGIEVGAGVVDSSYTGEIGVLLYNHSDVDYRVAKGDRIAQIIFEKHEHNTILVEQSLSATTRGNNGFGSSGYK